VADFTPIDTPTSVGSINPTTTNFRTDQTDTGISWPDAFKYKSDLIGPVGVTKSFSEPAAESSGPYSFPSIRGAAISVKDKLANISFVEGSAGEMSASIAYIRYWSRKGTQQKTAVGDTPIDGAVSDPQQQLAANFSSLSGFNPITQNFSSSGDGFPNFPVSNPSRTVLTIPTNTAYQSRPRQPVPTTTTSPRPAGPSFLNRLGSIFSANPGGAAAPPWANPFYTPAAAPAPDGAVWQFLFNPEELQLSSGPDFNRAETWGVDTAGNSGQPLSWRSNKNRKLTFGKVLLHGYTFGKRVDSLENGLQELFQARDGENGADGPPVLEFVWGQRVFGPCVIQNIQVREKAWDKGLLVNAEVSFDLEQVPEWTINDGFVDVLRPGRQSTINDPAAVSDRFRVPEITPSPESQQPANSPGGGSPLASQTYDQRKCQRAYFYAGLFKQFETRVNEVNINFRPRENISRIASEFLIKFQDATQELGTDFAAPSEATRIYGRIENILDPNRPEGRLLGGQLKGYVNGYIVDAYNRARNIYNNQSSCPGTYGKTVLQRPVSISSPTNL
jgi:hypothetical protein